MEHWLPLLEDRLETLFDHLGENDLVIRDTGADQAIDSRREAIDDYYQNRVRAMEGEPGSYRPLEPGALYFSKKEWETVEADRPIHLASTFPEPESDRVIDFGVQPARDFAPERAQQANVYEAVAKHIGDLRRSGHKVVLASYTRGARERLSGLLEDHGLKAQKQADNWQEALGSKTQIGRAHV